MPFHRLPGGYWCTGPAPWPNKADKLPAVAVRREPPKTGLALDHVRALPLAAFDLQVPGYLVPMRGQPS